MPGARAAGRGARRRPDTGGPAEGTDRRPQGRAAGWDAITYGLAGTLGPALVAVAASVTTALAAMLVLGAAAVAAAALTLPRADASTRSAEDALTVRAALRLLVAHGPLRRVGVATMLDRRLSPSAPQADFQSPNTTPWGSEA